MSEHKQDQRVSTMPSRQAFKSLREVKTLQEAFETKEFRDRIAQAAPKHLDPDTMLRTFIQAANKTPNIYRCDMRQALGAFMSLTYLGLPPNTPLGLSHLIPFKSRRMRDGKWEDYYDLQLVIGYPGYADLAYRSGMVKSIHSDVVLPGEHFRAEHGSHKVLEHRPELDHDTNGLTPRAAYAFVRLTDDEEFEVLGWADIMRLRNRSQSFQTAERARIEAEEKGQRPPRTWTDAPWVRDEREMAKKSAFRRLAKWLPRSPDLRAAVDLEEVQDRSRMDFGPVIDGTSTPMDGIPEAKEEEAPRDPGSTFNIRHNPEERRREADALHYGDESDSQKDIVDTSDNNRRTAGERIIDSTKEARQMVHDGDVPQRADSEPPAPPTAPFEAVLIDAFGEAGQSYTSPVQFAEALYITADRARQNGDQDLENLLFYNRDAILEAQKTPAAFKILLGLSSEDHPDDGKARLVETLPTAIEPPTERGGRLNWQQWAKAIKAGIGLYPEERLVEFCDKNREWLTLAPIAPRVLAIRAIVEAFSTKGLVIPTWLGELMSSPPEAA